MESAEQPTNQLHQQVRKELKAIGQPAVTVPAHEQPVLSEELRRIGEDITHTAGVEEFFFGKGPDTHVRVTSGGRLKRWVDRMRSIKEKFQRK